MSTAAAAPPRVMLIHAVAEAVAPIHAAFASGLPAARIYDLMDTSLSADHAAAGGVLTGRMIERFRTLGRYAAAAGPDGRLADAILFTCSAFGGAIDAVRRELAIPVLKPNEAAFERALDAGPRIGILVTFAPSLPALTAELEHMAKARGLAPTIVGEVATGGMEALRAGRPDEHDRLVAEAARRLPPVDAIVIGQFSAARAASAVAAVRQGLILTTPESAVGKLRATLRGRGE
ncbi:MAG TPA: aspartate/glutamate racemase family protein [Candidatus Sulfotelmatobacter sp.]|nr:aspartate/glutamate racemase family protein [Candidatus Sulfotelmatobacter sp.]